MRVLKVMKQLDKGMVEVHETYMRVKSEYCKSAIHDIHKIALQQKCNYEKNALIQLA